MYKILFSRYFIEKGDVGTLTANSITNDTLQGWHAARTDHKIQFSFFDIINHFLRRKDHGSILNTFSNHPFICF